VSWQHWRALVATYLRPHRGLTATLGLFLLGNIGLQVATPLIVRGFVNRAIAHARSDLVDLGLLYIGAVLVQQVCSVVSTYASQQLGWLTTNQLRADLMGHCLSLDAEFHRSRTPGEMIERIDGDMNGLSVFFGEFLMQVLGGLLLLVGVLVAVWIQSRLAGAVLSVLAVVALSLMTAVRRVGAPAWERARQASAALYGYIEERLGGTADIRSCGAEPHALRGFYARARDRTWLTSRARVMEAIPWATNGVIGAASNAVAFIVPAVLVRRGDLSLGTAFVLYFYTQLLTQPLSSVSQQVQQLQQAIAGGRRVMELLGIETSLGDGPGVQLPSGALDLGFQGVVFGYGSDPDVLHHIDINVPAGTVLGVVGRTGSGKSSLARLAVRLHDPRAGQVTLDGVDLRRLSIPDLRRRVCMVSQEVHVLRASVRDNLTWFDDRVDEAVLLDAVERMQLGPWLEALPDGLDTVVREGGAGLSAGQAQLLAFGRAFLADPGVVLLDEASSRLDPATEAVLERAVDALLRDRTGVVIAHRLATLARCDSICVLDHGRVVEYGPRQELADDSRSWFGRLLRTGMDMVPA
jgi:ATP-binding cassette, subfamily B, bacterial